MVNPSSTPQPAYPGSTLNPDDAAGIVQEYFACEWWRRDTRGDRVSRKRTANMFSIRSIGFNSDGQSTSGSDVSTRGDED